MTKKQEVKKTKKFLVERNNRKDLIVEVPEDWKVTFGPVVIPNGKSRSFGGPTYALRFYETDKKQRAIFTDVVAFRDLSIPVMTRTKTTVGEDKYEYDNKGNKHLIEKAKVEVKWESANEIALDFK